MMIAPNILLVLTLSLIIVCGLVLPTLAENVRRAQVAKIKRIPGFGEEDQQGVLKMKEEDEEPVAIPQMEVRKRQWFVENQLEKPEEVPEQQPLMRPMANVEPMEKIELQKRVPTVPKSWMQEEPSGKMDFEGAAQSAKEIAEAGMSQVNKRAPSVDEAKNWFENTEDIFKKSAPSAEEEANMDMSEANRRTYSNEEARKWFARNALEKSNLDKNLAAQRTRIVAEAEKSPKNQLNLQVRKRALEDAKAIFGSMQQMRQTMPGAKSALNQMASIYNIKKQFEKYLDKRGKGGFLETKKTQENLVVQKRADTFEDAKAMINTLQQRNLGSVKVPYLREQQHKREEMWAARNKRKWKPTLKAEVTEEFPALDAKEFKKRYSNLNAEHINRKFPSLKQEQRLEDEREPVLNQRLPALSQRLPLLNQRLPVLNQRMPVLNQRVLSPKERAFEENEYRKIGETVLKKKVPDMKPHPVLRAEAFAEKRKRDGGANSAAARMQRHMMQNQRNENSLEHKTKKLSQIMKAAELERHKKKKFEETKLDNILKESQQKRGAAFGGGGEEKNEDSQSPKP